MIIVTRCARNVRCNDAEGMRQATAAEPENKLLECVLNMKYVFAIQFNKNCI